MMAADTFRIRWMVRKDLEQVLHIEKHSFEYPWKKEDFVKFVRHHQAHAKVVEYAEQVLGYVMYVKSPQLIQIDNLAVHPEYLRHGIGSVMMEHLEKMLSAAGPERIRLLVSEANLTMHLFLKSSGFQAVEIKKAAFDYPPDLAGYVFEKHVFPNKQLKKVKSRGGHAN